MLATRPVKTSVKTLIRRALRTRHDAETVNIACKSGDIFCTFPGGGGKRVPFGNVADYSAHRKESGSVVLRAGSSVLFTFGPQVR